jgi:hypothetical protein
MSAVNDRLELPTQWSIHPEFHIDLLTPYVTCRWHARLDVSWVLSVANSVKVTILCTDPEPLLA